MCKLMIAFAFVLSLYLLVPEDARAQQESLVGHWEGAYVRLGAVQAVRLDFVLEGGKLKATYDVPELNIYEEPVTELSYDAPPQLVLRPKYGKFTMQVFPDIGEMTGDNKAWGPPVTLHLKRRPKEQTLSYPQEEVRFRNGTVALAGTLYKPVTAAPHPLMVIVHGSGAQGRAESYYRFWGNFFAQRGVAALLYDKRGVGRSTGNYETATFDDLAGDVVAAVELLRKRKDIDKARIGLFGISQGGWIAPLAASRTRAVSYLILNVGPSVSVEEQELHRVEYTMRGEGYTEPEIAKAISYTKQVFKTAYTGAGRAELDALTAQVREQKWAEQVQLVNSQKDLDDWRLIRYDPAEVLMKTKIPVLSIFGELDVLVPPKENQERMERYLRQAGNRDMTIRVIKGVGHDMENFGTLRGNEWKWPDKFWVWPRKSEAFYEAITGWLKQHGLARP